MRTITLAIILASTLILIVLSQTTASFDEEPTLPNIPTSDSRSWTRVTTSGTINIAVVNFSSDAYTVTEDTIEVPITVTLDVTTTLTLTLSYNSVDGSATAGQDYLPVSGILTFTPGITEQTFTVTVLEDTQCESDESVYLILGEPTQETFTLGLYRSARLTIRNDDPCHIYLPGVLNNYSPPPITDLLLNPDFEGDQTNQTIYGDDPTIMTPEFWVTWWEENPDLNMQRPEVRIIPNEWPYNGDPVRIHSGYKALQIFRGWSVYRAGFLQRVDNVPLGATAVFSTYAHAWACQEDPPPAYSCNGPHAFHFKVGIDPTGSTDPLSDNIVWSDKAFIYDIYDVVGPVTATVGTEGAFTVFIYAEPTWPLKFVDAYIDSAALIVYP